jgi:hypothetical protein
VQYGGREGLGPGHAACRPPQRGGETPSCRSFLTDPQVAGITFSLPLCGADHPGALGVGRWSGSAPLRPRPKGEVQSPLELTPALASEPSAACPEARLGLLGSCSCRKIMPEA